MAFRWRFLQPSSLYYAVGRIILVNNSDSDEQSIEEHTELRNLKISPAEKPTLVTYKLKDHGEPRETDTSRDSQDPAPFVHLRAPLIKLLNRQVAEEDDEETSDFELNTEDDDEAGLNLDEAEEVIALVRDIEKNVAILKAITEAKKKSPTGSPAGSTAKSAPETSRAESKTEYSIPKTAPPKLQVCRSDEHANSVKFFKENVLNQTRPLNTDINSNADSSIVSEVLKSFTPKPNETKTQKALQGAVSFDIIQMDSPPPARHDQGKWYSQRSLWSSVQSIPKSVHVATNKFKDIISFYYPRSPMSPRTAGAGDGPEKVSISDVKLKIVKSLKSVKIPKWKFPASPPVKPQQLVSSEVQTSPAVIQTSPIKKIKHYKNSSPEKRTSPDIQTSFERQPSPEKQTSLLKNTSPDTQKSPEIQTIPETETIPLKKTSPVKKTNPFKKKSPENPLARDNPMITPLKPLARDNPMITPLQPHRARSGKFSGNYKKYPVKVLHSDMSITDQVRATNIMEQSARLADGHDPKLTVFLKSQFQMSFGGKWLTEYGGDEMKKNIKKIYCERIKSIKEQGAVVHIPEEPTWHLLKEGAARKASRPVVNAIELVEHALFKVGETRILLYRDAGPVNRPKPLHNRTVIVKQSAMSLDMQHYCVQLARCAMDRRSADEDFSVAEYITTKLNKLYGSRWHCVVGPEIQEALVHNNKNHLFFFQFGYLDLLVWKT